MPVLHAANEKWSNPIGLPSGPLSFQDLFSLDPEFLQFIPKPVKAVLLLFPCRGELAEARKKEEDEGEGKFSGDVWWIKQTVRLPHPHLAVWSRLTIDWECLRIHWAASCPDEPPERWSLRSESGFPIGEIQSRDSSALPYIQNPSH